MTLTEGIHFDVPAAVYFADPCPEPSLTQSIAKVLIERSPAHAYALHPRLTPPDPVEPEPYNAAKAIGNAAHALIIGRGKTIAVADFDSWRTKEARAFRAAAIKAGQEPILAEHYAEAGRICAAAGPQLDAIGWADAFGADGGDDGQGEVVIVWQEDGIWLRTMIDWMADPRRPYDYKTTAQSVAPHVIGELAARAGWEIQAAMHERALDRIDPDGAGRRRFRYVAQEQERPWALTALEMDRAALTIGRKKLDFALRRWREAMETGHWPGYPPEVQRPDYPGWMETRWLEREVAEADRRERQPTRQPDQLDSLMGG